METLESVTRTEGEQVFEGYLASVGLDFVFEEEVAGTRRKPDYRIALDGEAARFEVKQFDPRPGDAPGGVGCISPYPPLREKIDAARKKFKGLKGTACSLVLYNNGRLVFLSPQPVFGAMLGDVGFTIPFDTRTGVGDTSRIRRTFLGGGKMLRYGKGGEPAEPWKTTISAIIAVSLTTLGSRRFRLAQALREQELGRELSDDERWAMLDDWAARSPGLAEAAPRVRSYENPFAAKPLSPTFGRGPWDERFGPDGDHLVRLYVGTDLAALEEQESAAGIKVDPWAWIG